MYTYWIIYKELWKALQHSTMSSFILVNDYGWWYKIHTFCKLLYWDIPVMIKLPFFSIFYSHHGGCGNVQYIENSWIWESITKMISTALNFCNILNIFIKPLENLLICNAIFSFINEICKALTLLPGKCLLMLHKKTCLPNSKFMKFMTKSIKTYPW